MHSTPIRLAVAGLLAAGAAAGASGAAAQSRCGETYEIQSGDTLYSIAQRCRVTLARIMDLNPSLGDPRDVSVGTQLRLEARDGGGGGDGAERTPETYRVEPGDTLYSIAQSLGVSLMELMRANEEINPFALAAGTLLDLPGDGPGASVSISPRSGPPDSQVTVRARNLRPNDWVTVGAGPRASEWSSLREVRTGPGGDLSATVAVPDWADPGDDLIFVVDTDRGVTLKSGVFDVTDRNAGGGDRVTVKGRVRGGPECPTLETPEGETWSIVSDSVSFNEGAYVEVTGTRADMSICMRGEGTIEVSSVSNATPPR